MEYCKEYGIVVEAYSPLVRGAATDITLLKVANEVQAILHEPLAP